MNFSKQNILIIEDNLDTLELMIEIFESEFASVYSATDGYEALEVLEKNKINVILCDINIPTIKWFRYYK
jgi:two-component system, OmpR family, response regulator VanR